ncbi:hypothetical protein ACWPNX_16155 [Acinetobacter baumannii]|uniref:hypothetical protein n=1 Tax=Acinetobacter baumannii TaxID=470 RepID=UPI003A84584E|nr:hypothetical protein [Acinetobacter baumannii]
MDKEVKQSLLLWGVVAYSVALLFYCSLKTLTGADADYISAFGSILSAFATIFASIIAIYIYFGWKKQHNKSIIANEAKDTFNRIHKERSIIHEIKFLLMSIDDYSLTRLPILKDKVIEKIKKLEATNHSNSQPTDGLINLVEGSKLYDLIICYNTHLGTFKNFDRVKMSCDFNIYVEITSFVKHAEKLNQDVLQELKTYIFA